MEKEMFWVGARTSLMSGFVTRGRWCGVYYRTTVQLMSAPKCCGLLIGLPLTVAECNREYCPSVGYAEFMYIEVTS